MILVKGDVPGTIQVSCDLEIGTQFSNPSCLCAVKFVVGYFLAGVLQNVHSVDLARHKPKACILLGLILFSSPSRIYPGIFASMEYSAVIKKDDIDDKAILLGRKRYLCYTGYRSTCVI